MMFLAASLRRSTEHQAQLVETRKTLCRRSIEQLAFIKDVNSLVALSGTDYSRCLRA